MRFVVLKQRPNSHVEFPMLSVGSVGQEQTAGLGGTLHSVALRKAVRRMLERRADAVMFLVRRAAPWRPSGRRCRSPR